MMHTFKNLKDHLVSVCELKCLNLLCNARNHLWFLLRTSQPFYVTNVVDVVAYVVHMLDFVY